MEPTISEIRIFAGNFPPRSWSFCDGKLLSIAQYQALFALIGTIYGGDGITTFALPDLRGRIPVGTGPGSGLNIQLGEMAGTETVTLTTQQIPAHIHTGHNNASTNSGTESAPSGNLLAVTSENIYAAGPASVLLGPNAVQVGFNNGGQPHNNIMPVLSLNYIIALEGIFPPRN